MLFGHTQIDGRGRPTEDRIAIRKLTPTIDLFAVFDGHAGSAVVKLTTDYLPKRIQAAIEAAGTATAASLTPPEALSAILRTAFLEHDKDLARSPATRNSGSTATVALVTPTHIIFAYAGDSPAFVFNPFTGLILAEIGKHEPTLASESARITAAGGTVEIDEYGTPRVNGELMVSRAFGDFSLKFPNFNQPPFEADWTAFKVTAAPDIVVLPRPQIGVLAIMSDGLVETATSALKPLAQVSRELQLSLKESGFNLTKAAQLGVQRHVAASVGSAPPSTYDGDDLSLVLVDVGLKEAKRLQQAAGGEGNTMSPTAAATILAAAAAAAAARPKTRAVRQRVGPRKNRTAKRSRLMRIFTL
jgi:serine/threonine protein phosphatase PrpC